MTEQWDELVIYECLNDACQQQVRCMTAGVCISCEKPLTRLVYVPETALAAARADAEKPLGELLAVIHRDGGHYQDEHGTDKAVADALVLIPQERVRTVELVADAEKRGYERAREQELEFIRAALDRNAADFERVSPTAIYADGVLGALLHNTKHMQPRPAEAGER